MNLKSKYSVGDRVKYVHSDVSPEYVVETIKWAMGYSEPRYICTFLDIGKIVEVEFLESEIKKVEN